MLHYLFNMFCGSKHLSSLFAEKQDARRMNYRLRDKAWFL